MVSELFERFQGWKKAEAIFKSDLPVIEQSEDVPFTDEEVEGVPF